ncbi:unnamed protein product [Didymodactylos carnosus]|uniref:Uncharacterized protein n=1 Tax=Didymodactylos carnosus TaxID=1234261 RepID=A0A814NRM4_9BILA|nr:unnamed protein product [Didymodactylos carnosus]CAF1095977.1 unnamed protein product [Didymodactylos carnosus]CAF3593245.1 unnamed protein product [Didymodactylos carnosus]CAF3861308.1 unnamed protein product [Didymodactylos carnosus]
MIASEELKVLWTSFELFMAISHFLVLIGVKNSKIGFLRRQTTYFLLDALTHLFNLCFHHKLLLNNAFGFLIYINWIVMFIGHVYYYLNLKLNPPKPDDKSVANLCNIFLWSCVEFTKNRFDIKQCGKEVVETVSDIVAHSAGYYYMFTEIKSDAYKILTILLMAMALYNRMIRFKYFLTEPQMMPKPLRDLYSVFKLKS